MQIYLLIGLGGAIGSVLRVFLNGVVAAHWGDAFPWGTLLINILGSLAIGFIWTYTGPEAHSLASPGLRLFLMAGLCGGFTTFSAFSLQTLNLARAGAWLQAGGNVVGSVVLCLVAVWLGHLLATLFIPAR